VMIQRDGFRDGGMFFWFHRAVSIIRYRFTCYTPSSCHSIEQFAFSYDKVFIKILSQIHRKSSCLQTWTLNERRI
jgi:hypothetical protein